MIFFAQDDVNECVKNYSMTSALVDCCVVFLHISMCIDHWWLQSEWDVSSPPHIISHIDSYCCIFIARPSIFLLWHTMFLLFQIFSLIFVTTFLPLVWLAIVPLELCDPQPSCICPQLCSSLTKSCVHPTWTIVSPLFLSHFEKVDCYVYYLITRTWVRHGLDYQWNKQQSTVHSFTYHFSRTLLVPHVHDALGACLWGRCRMTGKKGGIPAVITAKSQESRLFTIGVIFFKNRQCNDFFLHCCICIVHRCLATKFGWLAWAPGTKN